MPLVVTEDTRVGALIDAVAPCWAGEALVARRYFGGGHRTAERDLRWIGFQVFKEHTGGGVYGGPGATVASILADASRRAAAITLATPAPEIERILDDLAFGLDELRHQVRYMRLYALAGGDLRASIDSLGALDHARRLAALRHELRATPVGLTAVALSEGGGLGLHFGMREHFLREPPARALDREIAALTDAVLDDEAGHLRARFDGLALEGGDAAWDELETHLVAICSQKLRERNEQFSSPLDEAELAGIARDRELGRRYVARHLGFLGAR
jgi:hypothetical protein